MVMGVSGCGKSTVGQALSNALGGVFVEGDDYHPQSNIDHMAAGLPLTDAMLGLGWTGWLKPSMTNGRGLSPSLAVPPCARAIEIDCVLRYQI